MSSLSPQDVTMFVGIGCAVAGGILAASAIRGAVWLLWQLWKGVT